MQSRPPILPLHRRLRTLATRPIVLSATSRSREYGKMAERAEALAARALTDAEREEALALAAQWRTMERRALVAEAGVAPRP